MSRPPAKAAAERIEGTKELKLLIGCLEGFAGRLREGLDSCDVATRREIIRALVKRVEIGPEMVRVVYRVAPGPFANRPGRGVVQYCQASYWSVIMSKYPTGLIEPFRQQFYKFYENLMVRAGSPTLPAHPLYHYTSPAGLVGILEHNEIWATHLGYLNDVTEGVYWRQMATEMIEERLQRFMSLKDLHTYATYQGPIGMPGDYQPDVFEAVPTERLQGVEVLVGTYRVLLQESEQDLYVTSFCERDNVLSQWRGYADRGGGYSLGIEIGKQIFQNPNNAQAETILVKIEYDQSSQRGFLAEVLDKAVSLADAIPDPERQHHPFFHFGFPINVAGQLGTIGLSFKHQDFAVEEEWRLITRIMPTVVNVLTLPGRFHVPGREDLQTVHFREMKGLLAPFVKLPIDGQVLKLSSIRCGPTLDPKFARRSVKMLAVKHGFENVQVDHSDTPFRG